MPEDPDALTLRTPEVQHTSTLNGLRLDLQRILEGNLEWQPFRPGIEIFRLHGDGSQGSASALLRYAPGARLQAHVHGGYEHLMVLSGSQSDERGRYAAGTLLINPPGSKHSVSSEEGCIVLAIWERPVSFEV